MDKSEKKMPNYPALGLIIVSVALEYTAMHRYFLPIHDGLYHLGVPIGDDFYMVWIAARLAVCGHIGTIFHYNDLQTALNSAHWHNLPPHVFSYPPDALLIFAPFALFGYFTALSVWLVSGAAAYLFLLRTKYSPDWLTVLALLVSPAVWINIIDGQNGFFSASLFIGGFLLLDRYPIFAGVLFSFLTIKPQMGLVIPVALLRLCRWKTIFAACAGTSIFMAASVAAFGITPWQKFLTIIGPMQMNVIIGFGGFFTSLTVSPYGSLRVLGLDASSALTLQSCISLFVAATVFWRLPHTIGIHNRVLLLATAAPLMSPYVLGYDLCLSTLPLAWVLFGKIRPAWWVQAVMAVAWMSPVIGFLGAHSAHPWLQCFVPLSLMAVFSIVVRTPDMIDNASKIRRKLAATCEIMPI